MEEVTGEEYRETPSDASRAPEFFGIAEVVGKWVWIQFAEKQPANITSQLSVSVTPSAA